MTAICELDHKCGDPSRPRPLDADVSVPSLTLERFVTRLTPPPCLTDDDNINIVIKLFKDEPQCPGALVIEDDRVRALLSPKALAEQLARPFARDLFVGKPISRLLGVWDLPCLELPSSTSISEAIRLSLARPAHLQNEPVVVSHAQGARLILDIHLLLHEQCVVLETTLDELARQRQATEKAIHEREEMHRRLLDASRDAGRAEVATGVLHNVGNVLNSVNVSAALVTDKLRQSRLSNLGKAAAMLVEHNADLAQFLSADEKGRQLPGYIMKVVDLLVKEHAAIEQEVGAINNSIEHIKQIVQMQQSYAKLATVRESIRPEEIFADAERVNLVSFERHNIEVVHDYATVPPLPLDKHRILQILINLISNAKSAVKAAAVTGRRITLRVATIDRDGNRYLQYQVIDNGIGIPPENLSRIFAHGFTTRSGGHGFGLHTAANAAAEMGGTLTAASDGPGHGATFTLLLPLAAATEGRA